MTDSLSDSHERISNLVGLMNNGTSTAVLVTDLFRGDGPFTGIADDFVVMVCGFCGNRADSDARFTNDGFVCSACASVLSIVSK
jgi:hypothetical protein